MELTDQIGRIPFDDGYKMPAEWEEHAATLLHWPSNRETWPGGRLEKAENIFLEIIRVLHRYEPIILLVDTNTDINYVRDRLTSRSLNITDIHIYQVPINDVWARDCGPVFIQNEAEDAYAITDWEYNAWGEKYPPFDDDNNIPGWFSKKFDIPVFKPGMILEGGSIETNGAGTFLTTESVLLNPNRNPNLSKSAIKQRLRDYIGAEQVVWLKEGLAGDDTDGHIDDLSRFLNENTILTMTCDDPDNINYRVLKINLEILQQEKNRNGEHFTIETLPLPKTQIEGTTVDGSEFVPASYANFYIANGVVLVPLYDQRYDEQAMQLFKTYFPNRNIAGIRCSDLVWGQGSIHCITQQLYGIDL